MAPTTADIRKFLTELFSDEELTILCYDYFRDVYDDFALGMSKGQKIQRLIERCAHREAIPSLLAALSAERAAQYTARFGPPVEAVSAGEQPRPGRDPRQVFISHAHEDADFAHHLAADLQTHGWRVWIAPDSIRPGEKWAEAIERGLEECGIFVVVLTPAAVQSGWVKTETNLAIELQHQGEMRFIPLEVADCRIPLLWTAYQRVSFTGLYEHGCAKLLAELEGISATAEAPVSKPAAPKVEVLAAWQGGKSPDLLTMTFPIRIELVRVPAGEFLMGSDPSRDNGAKPWEQPQHPLNLPEFFIGKYPVTNAQYASFLKATRQPAPKHWGKGKFPSGEDDHPVVNVSWYDAVAFCKWLSQTTGRTFRLPTEAEWEKAARGSDGRIYPWGDQLPTESLCNFGNKVSDTTSVGCYLAGASPYGALDMSGNVVEWTSSLWGKDSQSPDYRYPYDPTDGRENLNASKDVLRVLRGSGFMDDAKDVRCAVRYSLLPSYCDDEAFGFRIVASLRMA
jgi:formylglycine-generating enzyme